MFSNSCKFLFSYWRIVSCQQISANITHYFPLRKIRVNKFSRILSNLIIHQSCTFVFICWQKEKNSYTPLLCRNIEKSRFIDSFLRISWFFQERIVLLTLSNNSRWIREKLMVWCNLWNKIEIIRYSNVTNTIVYVTKQKCICKKIVVTLPPKFEKTLIGIKKVRGGTWESNLWKQFKSPDTVLNHFTTN